MADTDELTDDTQDRVKAFQRQSDVIQSMRNADAASYKPPGSPSEFIGRESQPIAPVGYFQANGQTGPMLVPRGAEGIRGYPSAAEYDAANARDAAASKENQFNVDLNAVGSRYPTAPRFNMPSTDQLIDAGIQAKRDALQNEINTRLVHLGKLPPSAIGASASVLDSEQAPVTSVGRHGQRGYGASPASQTRAELAILEHQASGLDSAQADVIRQNSHTALLNAKENESLAQDTARAQVVDFLGNIDDSRYPHGSDDRQKFIGRVFSGRPDWLHVMAKDPHLAKYVQDHVDAQDKVASTMAQLKTLYPDEESLPTIGGVRMVPSMNAKGGVAYRGSTAATPEAKEQSELETRLHSQTGLTPDEFASISPDSARAGGIVTTDSAGKKIFHIEGGGFNVNGIPKGEFNNDFINFIDGYKPGETAITPQQEKDARSRVDSSHAIQIDTGKGYKFVIPRVDYERYRDAFGGQQGSQPNKKVLSVEDWLNQ